MYGNPKIPLNRNAFVFFKMMIDQNDLPHLMDRALNYDIQVLWKEEVMKILISGKYLIFLNKYLDQLATFCKKSVWDYRKAQEKIRSNADQEWRWFFIKLYFSAFYSQTTELIPEKYIDPLFLASASLLATVSAIKRSLALEPRLLCPQGFDLKNEKTVWNEITIVDTRQKPQSTYLDSLFRYFFRQFFLTLFKSGQFRIICLSWGVLGHDEDTEIGIRKNRPPHSFIRTPRSHAVL